MIRNCIRRVSNDAKARKSAHNEIEQILSDVKSTSKKVAERNTNSISSIMSKRSRSKAELNDQSTSSTNHGDRKLKFESGHNYSDEDLNLSISEFNARNRYSRVHDMWYWNTQSSKDSVARNVDWMIKTGIDVSREYKNAIFLSEYVNHLGQVLPRRVTGLSSGTQRRLVKTINFAVNLGVIPRTTKHWAAKLKQQM
ncbi:hypothetical protein MP228_002961 [Amoeboaphelidium protococcarum]|nr:hypothetical protein MP228_002961 [Amoeboaphelidium protococcarum]